jgi:hypothetical protein
MKKAHVYTEGNTTYYSQAGDLSEQENFFTEAGIPGSGCFPQ